MTRTYNRAGAVKTQVYPSGHSVTNNYDDAGRLADKDAQNLAFTGNLGDGVLRTYAAGISYSPWGSLGVEQFGTNTALYHKSHYNIRGQLFDTRLSSVNDTWDWNRGRLLLYYSSNHLWGQSGTDNNGNLRYAETWIPPENATLDQADVLMEDAYDYDALNRLSSVTEQRMSAGGGWVWQQQFKQAYSYDQYGNRTINAAQTWGTGINNKQFTIETSTNRLLVPVGQSGSMSYDAAGNLLTDTYSSYGSRVYDAENKMTAVQDSYAGWSYYIYDSNGNRTRRKINNQETWQVYGFGGELLAEYAANAAAASPQKEYGYRNGQLLVTAEAPTNLALPANGATVSASSTQVNPPFSYPVSAVNNGDRKGLNAGYGGNWSGSSAMFPQWVQVDFNGSKTISEIDVFSLQDNYASPIEPTESTTFSLYGLTGFDVQYWTGSAWATVPGGSVTGNNKVWKKISFAALSTTKVRVLINATSDGWSRMVEVEAWSASVKWLVTDHLGTPRMIVDQTGTLATLKRHDYLPFGEELFAGTGGRTTALGYSGGDNVRQQFTQKERDLETGLDYLLARYYSSTQGRFTSADQPFFDQEEGDPQSWNLYRYAANNPLLFTDPTGMWHWVDPENNGQRFLQWDKDDDWQTLAAFLNNNSNDTYYEEDLRAAFGGGGLGAGVIVDVTGASPRFTNSRGGVTDSSWALIPLGRGPRIIREVIGAIRLFRATSNEAPTIPSHKIEPVQVNPTSTANPFSGGGTPKASEIAEWARAQGWSSRQTPNGPLKFVDENGIVRVTIKRGTPRAPGSDFPHVEIRNSAGQRVGPAGNPVTRTSPGNHTRIDWDL